MVRLAMPQVVRYCLDHNVPCTLVTDQGDATNVYINAYPSLGRDFIITAAAAPVRTTPSVLNSLAGAIRRCSLSNDQRRLICDIATRMWWRLPWDQVRAVYAPARALVKPVAYYCAWDHPGNEVGGRFSRIAGSELRQAGATTSLTIIDSGRIVRRTAGS